MDYDNRLAFTIWHQDPNYITGGNLGIMQNTPSSELDIVGRVEVSNTSTGSNAGTDLCIDANNRICKCNQCA